MGSYKSLCSMLLLLIIFQASLLAAVSLDEIDRAVAAAQAELDKGQRKYSPTNDYYEYDFYFTKLLQKVANRPTGTASGSKAHYLKSLKKATSDFQKYTSTRENLITQIDQHIKAIDALVLNKNVPNGLRRKLSQERSKLLHARNDEDNACRIRAINDYEQFNANEIDENLFSVDKNDDCVDDQQATTNPSLTAEQIVNILRCDPEQLKTLADLLKSASGKDTTDSPDGTDDEPGSWWQ